MNKSLNLKTSLNTVTARLRKARHYSVPLFLLLVLAVYGFVLMRIQSLSNVEPSQQDVTSQVKAAHITHIDPAVVKQLESLQDNSVSVQALFDEARSNPFQ